MDPFPKTWSADELNHVIDPPVDWGRFLDPAQGDYLADQLERFFEWGFLHFINVPAKRNELLHLQEIFGFLIDCPLGYVFMCAAEATNTSTFGDSWFVGDDNAHESSVSYLW